MEQKKIESKKPQKKCYDKNCPFHGNLSLRGREFKGTVVSSKAHKTVSVEWQKYWSANGFKQHPFGSNAKIKVESKAMKKRKTIVFLVIFILLI